MREAEIDSPTARAVFAYKHYVEDMIVEVARPYGNNAPDGLVIVVLDYQNPTFPGNVVLSTLDEVAAYMADQEQNHLTDVGREEWRAFKNAQVAEWKD